MKMWVAIALGIVVLTVAFVVAQRDRGGDIAAPAEVSSDEPRAVSPAELPGVERSSPAQAIGADATTGQAGSSVAVPEAQMSPPRSESDLVPTLDSQQRAQIRAEGNARISAANAGSNEPDPTPMGGGDMSAEDSRAAGIPDADIVSVEDQSAFSGPLPGEGEPQVPGPLPGEGEPQVYGPLPGENDPQVLGPLPGEGEPEQPPGPLPGED